MSLNEATPIPADLLLHGAQVITMNANREVLVDGAVAIRGDRIVAVGPTRLVRPAVTARETRDVSGFVLTPGYVDGHIHITGDPLTRGFVRRTPDDSWGDNLSKWVIPIFRAHNAEEEKLSGQLAAMAMIRGGTTTFIEAGTVIHLDAVMEGLAETGIRGRVGQWVEGRAWSPEADANALIDQAIALLTDEVAAYPDDGQCLLAAWPVLVGHSTNPDPVWLAARDIARSHGLRVSAHMSPRQGDPDWYLANHGRRPLEHLAAIGALGPEVCLTHLAAIDHAELDVLVESGAGAIHCAHAAFQGAMGLARQGLHPEMLARGVPLMLGTDGMAADILSSGRLMASAYRDAREDQDLLPATEILEMATLHAARAMGWSDRIGALVPGMKADFVLHDTRSPEWGGPVFDAVGQLVFCAPTPTVSDVWIDGRQVLSNGRNLLLDEERLLAEAVRAGHAVIARTGLPSRTPWPLVS